MSAPKVTSIPAALESVTFEPNRVPSLNGVPDAFVPLGEYRQGQIWVGHYAGDSEWERHPMGDELLQVIDGETTLVLWLDKTEHRQTLTTGDLFVVPANVWHRFKTPNGVKILTITPQPSDHQLEQPE